MPRRAVVTAKSASHRLVFSFTSSNTVRNIINEEEAPNGNNIIVVSTTFAAIAGVLVIVLSVFVEFNRCCGRGSSGTTPVESVRKIKTPIIIVPLNCNTVVRLILVFDSGKP